MLLALPNVDVTHVTYDGKNALFHGSVDSTAPHSTQRDMIVKLLLQCPTLDVGHKDKSGFRVVFEIALVSVVKIVQESVASIKMHLLISLRKNLETAKKAENVDHTFLCY